ncbi:MAG: TonB-dependent receptor, partial [Planctomycetota bacterium]
PEDFATQGVSDVADALAAVPGANVADDATAVIRGLPDRYVPSLVNGVRLPSASEEKRAVELDQFPTNIVQTISVSKTFLPDSQGDASGGSVDVQLRSIPDEGIFNFNVGTAYDSQLTNEQRFLLYEGGGVGALGRDAGNRRPQLDRLGQGWEGAIGVEESGAPNLFKFAGSVGDSVELDNGMKIGGFLSLFYDRDGSFRDNEVNDRYWVDFGQTTPSPIEVGEGTFGEGSAQTALFDIVRATEEVQWGGTASLGLEIDPDNQIGLQFLYTHTADDSAILAEDTRGKLFRFPNYDVNDPAGPGNTIADDTYPITAGTEDAPYIRTHSLVYNERTVGSTQLRGEHVLRMDEVELGGNWRLKSPELGWTLAQSFSNLDQPDKRLFGATWLARSFVPAGVNPAQVIPPRYEQFKPAESINLGNFQRVFTTIEEDSSQGKLDLTLPFEQWAGDEGEFKIGYFTDRADREFRRQSFSNTGGLPGGGPGPGIFFGDFSEFWTDNFQEEQRPINASEEDADYDGSIDIAAWYGMVEVPVSDSLRFIGGARVETTDIGVTIDAEDFVTWIPPGASGPAQLLPGDADVDQKERSLLPALTAIWDATDRIVVRAAVSKTIARQTFRELTPIIQREFQGGPIFLGNPELRIAELDNYDLRVDYEPTDSTFLSTSIFHKEITNPIETIQQFVSFSFTTPANFPEGELSGIEFEARQDLGGISDSLEGLSVGFNATFIDSEVTFPERQFQDLSGLGLGLDSTTRDATNAPDRLLNFFVNYNLRETGTQFGLFYTVQGETLVAGEGVDSEFRLIPAVYQKEFGTLNLTVAQRLTDHLNLRIAARNLTNPSVDQVFRSDAFDEDILTTTFTRGVEYSVGLSASYSF